MLFTEHILSSCFSTHSRDRESNTQTSHSQFDTDIQLLKESLDREIEDQIKEEGELKCLYSSLATHRHAEDFRCCVLDESDQQTTSDPELDVFPDEDKEIQAYKDAKALLRRAELARCPIVLENVRLLDEAHSLIPTEQEINEAKEFIKNSDARFLKSSMDSITDVITTELEGTQNLNSLELVREYIHDRFSHILQNYNYNNYTAHYLACIPEPDRVLFQALQDLNTALKRHDVPQEMVPKLLLHDPSKVCKESIQNCSVAEQGYNHTTCELSSRVLTNQSSESKTQNRTRGNRMGI